VGIYTGIGGQGVKMEIGIVRTEGGDGNRDCEDKGVGVETGTGGQEVGIETGIGGQGVEIEIGLVRTEGGDDRSEVKETGKKVGLENRNLRKEGWDTIEEYEDRRLWQKYGMRTGLGRRLRQKLCMRTCLDIEFEGQRLRY
jgi:hypothetical protein